MRLSPVPLLGFTALALLAADGKLAPFAAVKPILDSRRAQLPAELEKPDEAKWNSWARAQDKAIRARLEQGDLDSMVNLLLFGTSFTKQPRIRIENITEASKAGTLRARVDDLVAGLRNPHGNERLDFLNSLLRGKGLNPGSASADTGVFIYSNLQRVLQERAALAKRAAEAKHDTDSILDRSSLFRDRGVSLDTAILPDFALEQTLRDLKTRGVLREGQVARVAVVGPGLDFIDKNEESGYDYYPQQTVQPFALYDSLLRLGLAPGRKLSIAILDISPRVIDHVQHARERARKNQSYVIQLPRDVDRPWPPALVDYWRALGDQIGTSVPPVRPPELFKGLETRAVRIRPDVVLASEPIDLNIVLERRDLSPSERYDLVVGTNIFVYYDPFQQSLALENIGAMLKPGGLLLTNDKLPEVPAGSMREAGITTVRYSEHDPTAIEAVGWYRKN
ncbi:MAG TPA: class I SAM-dependent methyltransferase [Bryobacteraceae bacterium]|nr:class I SAM-dependent methyltransferase [Bryobacteraceae bacterium]